MQNHMKDEKKLVRKIWNPKSFLNNELALAVIFLNQPIPATAQDFVKKNWKSFILKIATDGGILELEKVTGDKVLVPDLICGDFDSVSKEKLDQYSRLGAQVIHTPDQDFTDFSKSLKLCFDIVKKKNLKIDAVLVISNTVGRLDHLLGNLDSLYYACKLSSTPVFLVTHNNICWLMEPGQHKVNVCKEMKDSHVGLIPLGEPCNNITTTGLVWNLTNGMMKFGTLISICNKFDGSDTVTVNNDQSIIWTMEFSLV